MDPDTVLQMVVDEWKPSAKLEPSEVRLILDSYVTARHTPTESTFSGNMDLANLVDQFVGVWGDKYQQKETVANPTAADPTAPADLTAADVAMMQTESWPPADFAPVERHLFMDSRLIDKLRGVDNAHPKAPDIPEKKTEPLEIQKFLSLLALSYFPETYRFALYPRPIAYMTHKDKVRAHNSEFGTVGGFVEYAYDMLNHHNRNLAIGLAMFPNRTCPKAVVIQKMGQDYAKGLRFVCLDPLDHMFDELVDGITKRVNEKFGQEIKEAWWGGWTRLDANNHPDLTDWVCTFIQDVVYDEIWMPTYSMESRGYNNVTFIFDSIKNLPIRPHE
ncbi:hypothetical protein F4818DRAFT_457691 [Hypoxylon cercidicola]|nr:hypothetical protein F4818DRAFT_457691 [Hypoxylon cercidicola]